MHGGSRQAESTAKTTRLEREMILHRERHNVATRRLEGEVRRLEAKVNRLEALVAKPGDKDTAGDPAGVADKLRQPTEFVRIMREYHVKECPQSQRYGRLSICVLFWSRSILRRCGKQACARVSVCWLASSCVFWRLHAYVGV